ncbi:prolipoprotein diacylglyceryl transferase [compost metagenome]
MQEAIVWGPLIIKYNWIAMAFSAFAAYIAMKYWLKDMSEISKSILEDITNSLLWAFLIWKFSVIIFNPVAVINNPYYILYFSGGERGILLSAMVVLIFLSMQCKKRRITFWMYAAVLAAGLLSYKWVYSLFQLIFNYPTPSFLYDLSQIVLATVLLIWMYSRKKGFEKPQEINQLIMWFSIGQMTSYFFKSFSEAVFLGLSTEQLVFFAVALCCLMVQNVIKKENFNES